MHTLPALGYEYSALEPYVDARTMELHHGKHHQAYIDKLNTALTSTPELIERPVEDLVRSLSSLPDTVRTAVRNHGGGHYNHSFFWKVIGPAARSGAPSVELGAAIDRSFGSLDTLKDQWRTSALGVFGSGWVWLCADAGRLSIVTTANQDTPLTQNVTPIFAADVWEHAYYLSYQNRRADYIDALWNVIQWEEVHNRFIVHGGSQ